MADVMSVARLLVSLGDCPSDPEEADRLTPLRLQKLLYYAQGWSLAIRGQPLYDAVLQAWRHGPVVPGVYRALKHVGAGVIDPQLVAPGPALTPEEQRFVEFVWEEYRRFSASALREMSHREAPWLEARPGLSEGDHSEAELTHESLARFFRAEALRRAEQQGIPGLDPADVWAASEEAERGELISHEEAWRRLRSLP